MTEVDPYLKKLIHEAVTDTSLLGQHDYFLSASNELEQQPDHELPASVVSFNPEHQDGSRQDSKPSL